jgi:DNA-directed RNA polymerase specialized sigma24 family protein
VIPSERSEQGVSTKGMDGTTMTVTNDNLKGVLDELVAWLKAEGEPLAQADECGRAQKALIEAAAEIKAIRVAAVRRAQADGWSTREIARALGITQGRVGQISDWQKKKS